MRSRLFRACLLDDRSIRSCTPLSHRPLSLAPAGAPQQSSRTFPTSQEYAHAAK